MTDSLVRVRDRQFQVMISPEEIAREVARIGQEIDRWSREDRSDESEPLLLLCVLKGANIFCADLMRGIKEPLALDVVGGSSYGEEMTSSGSLTFTAHPGTEIRGRDVIVVEDIVDSGETLAGLRRYLQERGAASVQVAALLYKPTGSNAGPPPEYQGFTIDDRFVVGYGLDYGERGRQLPAIYALSGE